MSSKEYESTAGWQADTSDYNAFDYAVTTMLNKKVNTALPVTVTAVEGSGSGNPTGYVDVKPLVKQWDAECNAIEQVDIYHLPYLRIHGGKCAVVCDPCEGDIGLAVFAKKDCSNLQQGSNSEVQPGSFRQFSMSDGFYIGGFLNAKPSVYIELLQDGKIVIHPTSGSSDAVCIEGNTTIKGSLCVAGQIYSDDSEGVNCDVNIKGKINATQNITSNADVKAGSVSLSSHTHGGVERGGSNTDKPNS